MISRNTTDNIRQLNIVDVVRKYIDLKPAGRTLKAKSPFNSEEKTPSFYVVPAQQFFKCHSTGIGGDSITFVMKFLKLGYVEAVKEICKEFQISFEDDGHAPDPAEVDRLKAMYAINEQAAQKFHDELMEGIKFSQVNDEFFLSENADPVFTSLHDEIKRREFTHDTIVKWKLGYAPDQWKFLTEKIIQSGNYQNCIDLGLIKTTNETNYDFFRHRLIFPIEDERGRIVSFGGRMLKDAKVTAKKDGQDKGDKYLNSCESPIYNKSKTLYGLFHAIAHIQKVGHANITEGYTDVISMHQAGFNNTVGVCGTSLTDDQILLLKRYTQKVVMWNDPDKAGIAATLRDIDMFLMHGLEVETLPLPEGLDPDDFVRSFNQKVSAV